MGDNRVAIVPVSGAFLEQALFPEGTKIRNIRPYSFSEVFGESMFEFLIESPSLPVILEGAMIPRVMLVGVKRDGITTMHFECFESIP